MRCAQDSRGIAARPAKSSGAKTRREEPRRRAGEELIVSYRPLFHSLYASAPP